MAGGGWGGGWFYQARLRRELAGPAVHRATVRAELTNTDASNNASSLRSLSRDDAGLRSTTEPAIDRVADRLTGFPDCSNGIYDEDEVRGNSVDLGYVASYGDPADGAWLNQPVLASAANLVNCGYDGNPAHCITTKSRNAKRARIRRDLDGAVGKPLHHEPRITVCKPRSARGCGPAELQSAYIRRP